MVACNFVFITPSSALLFCAQAYKRHTYSNQQSDNSGGVDGRLEHKCDAQRLREPRGRVK